MGKIAATGKSVPLFHWVGQRALAGRWTTLGIFLLMGLIIYIFLFLTVHNRNVELYSEQHREWARYRNLIITWIQEGPFKYGDFRLVAPFEKKWTESWGAMEDSKEYIYNSYPMAFLRGAYVLQFMYYKIHGRFSQTLMCMHNQALVWLSSAFLGFFIFRACRRLLRNSFPVLLLGCSVQAVYQTFPYNLSYYWEPLFIPANVIFFAVFLILMDRLSQETLVKRIWYPVLGFIVFLMSYTDYVNSFFMLATYFLVVKLTNPSLFGKQKVKLTIIFPALAAFIIFLSQRVWVGLAFPDLAQRGSAFMFRTGLDGNAIVGDHWSILFSFTRGPLGRWYFLAIAGFASLGALVSLKRRIPEVQYHIIILAAALGLYIPKAFLLSQETAIHPYYYDTYLVIPLILSLFGFLPAALEKETGRSGIFVFVSTLLAFCYSFVQLRVYALAYPLPTHLRWIWF